MKLFRALFGSKDTAELPHVAGKSFDFQKAIDYLDCRHYSEWRFEHFEEANRLAGSPYTNQALKTLWEAAAQAGTENQALMLGEAFRRMANR